MPRGLSPFFGPVAVVVEYFSQVVRPFALALRITLHGLRRIALIECIKYVFFMLARWIARVRVERCRVFINLGRALNLKREYWNFLWNPRVVWLGLSDNFFYLIAAWALLWVELAEFILIVVQIGVFVGLFLFFTSEHPQKHWVVVKEETRV